MGRLSIPECGTFFDSGMQDVGFTDLQKTCKVVTMETIRLGKTGMNITPVGFGGIPIQRLSEADAVKVIRKALDLGINWIDTAHGYSTSEERIGKAIKGYDRDKFMIFTKGPGKDAELIKKQMSLSFERLGIDAIDLYQFHNPTNPEVWKTMQENGTVDAVLEMKAKGKIRHVASSAHSPQAALAILEHPEIEVLQFPFNFIMAVEKETMAVLEKCREKDIGFIAMKPFAGGVADDAEICIRFLLQYPDVVMDPGFETADQVEEVVALWKEGAALTSQNKQKIDQLRKELGTQFCRRCGYCQPCPEGVAIPGIMNLQSFFKRFPDERMFSGFLAAQTDTYENCTDCGECEEKCPYDLSIRDTMRFWMEKYNARKQVYLSSRSA
jgi:predicted aldo/keto reductase-like oxidoreductase